MARAGDIVCRWSTEEQWGAQEFLGRVEWEGGGFERFQDFLEESESVSSLIISSVQPLIAEADEVLDLK